MLLPSLSFLLFLLLFFFRAPGLSAAEREIQRPAIVLVTPGPVDPNNLKALTGLGARVQEAFPCYEIRYAFTRAASRKLWNQRGGDCNFKKYFPWVDERFYAVKNTITILALIQEAGPRLILVQPLELVDGREYHDLVNIVENLRRIKSFDRDNTPFPYIGLGSPAMGLGGGQKENLFQMAGVLSPLYREAEEREGAALLVVDSRGEAATPAYKSFQDVLSLAYPAVPTFIGLSGQTGPGAHVLDEMRKTLKPETPVFLASLAFELDDELRREIFGEEEGTWLSAVKARGLEVVSREESLCESRLYADLFIGSLKKMEESVSRRYTD
ncbi:MAG: sirohydrochlorin cobaltochelatase [Deltaproteobacteria bacterium]|jgi:cobalamin biosynthesis Co2+ chelatase CbiK|nr:sirohydrochlorin cobaltochelatase [Deltaproteobacteria bacterium]